MERKKYGNYETRPDLLPGISRVGWAGAVTQGNGKNMKRRPDIRTGISRVTHPNPKPNPKTSPR